MNDERSGTSAIALSPTLTLIQTLVRILHPEMRGQGLRELVQLFLQPLHVGVLCRFVEFLEMMHDPAYNGRQLPAQDQEGGCRRLGEGFRLRDRRVRVVQVVLVQVDVGGRTGLC